MIYITTVKSKISKYAGIKWVGVHLLNTTILLALYNICDVINVLKMSSIGLEKSKDA